MAFAPFTTIQEFQQVLFWNGSSPFDPRRSVKCHAMSALCDPFFMNAPLAALIGYSPAFERDLAFPTKLSVTWPTKPEVITDGSSPAQSTPSPVAPNPVRHDTSQDVSKADLLSWISTTYTETSSEPLIAAMVSLFVDHYSVPVLVMTDDWLEMALANPSITTHVVDFLLAHKNFDLRTDSLLALLALPNPFPRGPTPEERSTAIRLLKAVSRIANVVAAQALVAPLLKAKYESAFQIQANGLDDLKARVSVDTSLIPLLEKTYANAANIAARNHVEARSTLVAISDFVRGTGLRSVDSGTARARTEALDNLMQSYCFDNTSEDLVGEIDNFQCDDCKSFTSPAAYLVEILRFLPDDARAHLLQRRPDIANLNLSCENTDVALPYMDLAIEVMESYIENVPQGKVTSSTNIDAFNTSPDDDSTDLIADPKIAVPSVYPDRLLKSSFPFPNLPYNLGLDKSRQILNSFGTSRYELLTTFQDEISQRPVTFDRSLGPQPQERQSQDVAIAGQRAATAEYLNLYQQDYVAITKEAFWGPEQLSRALKNTDLLEYSKYNQKIELPNVCKLWGYDSSDDMKSKDETKADTRKGLFFLKEAFLPRSGLSYAEYVRLAATQHIGSCLPDISGMKSNDIHYSLDLPDFTWDRIQSFLRLRLRSGLSIEELDGAITLFAGWDSSNTRITPDFLDTLVAIQKVHALTGVDILSLLTIWGPIPLDGPQILFKTMFLRRNIQRLDPVFATASRQDLETGTLPWQEHLSASLAAVGCTQAAYAVIQKSLIGTASDWTKLSIQNLSILYRCVILAKCMNIPQTSVGIAMMIFPFVFGTPQDTLSILETWTQFTKCGYTIDQVWYMIADAGDSLSSVTIPEADVLQAAQTINSGLLQIRDQFDLNVTITAEQTNQLVSKIFGIIDTKNIMDLLLGTSVQMIDQVPSGLEDKLKTSQALPSKLRYIDGEAPAGAQMQLQGMLIQEELDTVLSNLTTIDDGKLTDVVKKLQGLAADYAQETVDLINKTLFPVRSNIAQLKNLSKNNPLLEGDSDGSQPDEISTKDKKLQYFNALITPYLKRSAQEQVIATAISSVLGTMDAQLLLFIIKNLMRRPEVDAPDRGISVDDGVFGLFVSICEAPQPFAANDKSWSGYLSPPTSQIYTFVAITEPSAPIQVDGMTLTWTKDSKTARWTTPSISLVTEKVYSITFPVSPFLWKHTSMPESEMGASTIMVQDLFDRTQDLLWNSNKIALALAGVNMSREEISFLNTYGREDGKLGFYFTQISTDVLKNMCAYNSVRRSMSDVLSEPVLGLLRWAYEANQQILAQENAPASSMLDLAQPLASLLGFNQDVLALILPGTLKTMDKTAALTALQSIRMIETLVDKIISLKKAGMDLDASFVSSVCAWVDPYQSITSIPDDAEISDQVTRFARSRVGDAAWNISIAPINDQLRQHRRDALIGYLLQLDFLKDWGITDADSLFEYFLIDVQMGTATLTSRIKQAISTVQLFVKRALLGFEPPAAMTTGQSTSPEATTPFIIDRDRWSWFQSYRAWEANRKISLFPENWLNSSVLDTKTPLFEAFESDLRQSKVNVASAQSALEVYLHGLNDIANLEYITYYQDTKVLHLFAKTWHTPYLFYHRTRDASSGWSPWIQMQVDIPTYQYDTSNDLFIPQSSGISGNYLIPYIYRSRLLLFIPRFSKVSAPGTKSLPSTVANSTTSKAQWTWNIQLSWSEYKGGIWSPAKVLPVFVTDVKSSFFPDSRWSLPPNPGVYAFTSKNGPANALTITVSRQRSYQFDSGGRISAGDNNFQMIGQFFVDCSQITASSSSRFDTGDSGAANAVSFNGLSSYDFQISKNEGTVFPQMWKDFQSCGLNQNLLLKNGTNTNDIMTGSNSSNQQGSLLTEASTNVVYKMSHTFAHDLLDSILDVDASLVTTITSVSTLGTAEDLGATPNRGPAEYDPLGQAYSTYNWEIGLFIPMLLVDSLLDSQQFDDALNVIRSIFDPHITSPNSSVWKFKPFQDMEKNLVSSALFDIVDITHQQDAAFDPFLVARERPQRFMIWVALKYVQILIAYGDYYFRQNTLESIPEAIQCYIEASHIYGPRQEVYENNVQMEPTTFVKLLPTFALSGTTVGKFLADMECYSPYYRQPTISESLWLTGDTMTCKYFCMPLNTNQTALRDTIDDRLFKIRNSLDINGNARVLPLFEPPIDPGVLIQAATAGSLASSNVLNDLNAPLVNVRFKRLMQKALDTCYDLRTFWSNLLSAKESKDEAALAELLASQNTITQNLTLDLKKIVLEQANKTLEALQESREGVVDRMKHFLKLTGNSDNLIPAVDKDFQPLVYDVPEPVGDDKLMSKYERVGTDATVASMLLKTFSLIPTGIAIYTNLIPKVRAHEAPLGVGLSEEEGGDHGGKALEAIVKAMETGAELLDTTAELCMQQAERQQRLAERQLEVNEIGYALKGIDRQVAIQQTLKDMAQKDIDNQTKMIGLAQDVEKSLASKHVNLDMLTWLESSLQKIYYETYTIVYDMGKKAEKAYRFELGIDKSVPNIIDFGYWDLSHDGAYVGEKLYNALKKLQTAYDETRGFDFEITKSISLRQLDSSSLFKLRSTGTCNFSLPEVLFDLDFPGQIRRRITSVSVSFRGVTSSSIASTLSLLEHKYRVNDVDDTFQSDNIPISSIAVSTPTGDNGTSLDFSANSFLPFEGAGAISKWSFDLSPFSNIDPGSISDMIIQLKYTSTRGSNFFKTKQMTSVQNFLSAKQSSGDSQGGMSSAFDLSTDFDTIEWKKFAQSRPSPTSAARTFSLSGLLQKMPYYARVSVSKVMTSKLLAFYLVVGGNAATQGGAKFSLATKNTAHPRFSFDAMPVDPAAAASEWSLMNIANFNGQISLQDADTSSIVMDPGFTGEVKPMAIVLQWTCSP